MSPDIGGAGAGVPQRPFRGRDQQEEGQFNPLFRALDGGIGQRNLSPMAVLPVLAVPIAGGVMRLDPGNVDWRWVTFSFAASTATQQMTFTHDLGRVPQGYLNAMLRPLDPALNPVSTGVWNETAIIFAITSSAAAVTYRIILM